MPFGQSWVLGYPGASGDGYGNRQVLAGMLSDLTSQLLQTPFPFSRSCSSPQVSVFLEAMFPS